MVDSTRRALISRATRASLRLAMQHTVEQYAAPAWGSRDPTHWMKARRAGSV